MAPHSQNAMEFIWKIQLLLLLHDVQKVKIEIKLIKSWKKYCTKKKRQKISQINFTLLEWINKSPFLSNEKEVSEFENEKENFNGFRQFSTTVKKNANRYKNEMKNFFSGKMTIN